MLYGINYRIRHYKGQNKANRKQEKGHELIIAPSFLLQLYISNYYHRILKQTLYSCYYFSCEIPLYQGFFYIVIIVMVMNCHPNDYYHSRKKIWSLKTILLTPLFSINSYSIFSIIAFKSRFFASVETLSSFNPSIASFSFTILSA